MSRFFGTSAVKLLRGRSLQPVVDANEALAGKKYVLVYFSAHWCPPCRAFTPQLKRFYERHSAEKDFDVVFVSLDNSEGEMRSYMESAHGDWLAMSFDHARGVGGRWAGMYGIRSIPALLVFENVAGEKGERVLITRAGRDMVSRDPEAERFPWRDGDAEADALHRASLRKVGLYAVVAIFMIFYLVFRGS